MSMPFLSRYNFMRVGQQHLARTGIVRITNTNTIEIRNTARLYGGVLWSESYPGGSFLDGH